MIIVLLVSTTGMTVSKHYCGDSLVDVNVFSEAKSCCEAGCSTGCCHDESEHFELDENFLVTATDIDFQEASIELLIPFTQHLVIKEVEQQNFELSGYSLPPPKKVPDFLSVIQVYRL